MKFRELCGGRNGCRCSIPTAVSVEIKVQLRENKLRGELSQVGGSPMVVEFV